MSRMSSGHHHRGLRILSIDGGGVRGYSPLLILKKIEERISVEMKRRGREEEAKNLRPYQLFDLIVGSSTGGLIAIMLGRLCMSIDEAIESYESLSKQVFSKKKKTRILGRYYSREREHAIRQVIEQQLQDGEAKLLNNPDSEGCRVAVTSLPVSIPYGKGGPTLHRSYLLPEAESDSNITILLAAMATTAAPVLFKPVRIKGEDHIDGAFEFNNPTAEARLEAERIWNGRQISCMLSIGTGRKITQPLQQTILSHFYTIRQKVVDTTPVHSQESHHYQTNYPGRRVYFRFDVHTLSDVHSYHYKKLGQIRNCTALYLSDLNIESSIEECALSLVPLRRYAYPSISAPEPPITSESSTEAHLRSLEQNSPSPTWAYKNSRDYHPSLMLFAHSKHRRLMEQINEAIDIHLIAKKRIEENASNERELIDIEVIKLLKAAQQGYLDVLHVMEDNNKIMGPPARFIKYQLAQIDRFLASPQEAYNKLKLLLEEVQSQEPFDLEIPTFVETLYSLSIICEFEFEDLKEANEHRHRRYRWIDNFIATRPWHSISGYLAQIRD